MRKFTAVILVTTASALLAGCGGGGLFNRERPDEFAVQRQSPLVVPPDFALTPPQQGAPRPAETNSQQQTLDALFGGPAPRSDVEKNTIGRAGGAAPGIRSNVGDNNTNTVAKGEVTRDILAAPQGDGREAQAVAGASS
ncbi:MAG: DUF3035 domain-containing protein [Sphingomonadales bacterium]|nr:DUF3035 domain-containing protein [Sphingomonadales bacterium]